MSAIYRLLHIFLVFCISDGSEFIGELPPAQNVTADRIRSQSQCHTYSCSLFWLNREKDNARKTGLKSDCNWRNKTFANHFRAFFERKASWTYLKSFVEQRHFRLCLESCSFPNFFEFYHKYITFLHEYYKTQLTGGLCWPPLTLDYCYWSGLRFRFNFYFAIVAIPATILANAVNIATMKQMMGGTPGTALYLHMAEVVSSCLFNFVLLFIDCLHFTAAIDTWRGPCAYGIQYVSIYQGCFTTKYYLRFLNQCFLTALVVDRLYAVAKPIAFLSANMKRRSWIWIGAIIIGVTIIFIPYFTISYLHPILFRWQETGEPEFWKENRDRLDALISGTISVLSALLLVTQAICGFFVEHLFRKRARTNEENQPHIRNRDRDKKLLLVGTIGLNIVTGVINNILSLASNLAFYQLLNINFFEQWQVHLITMLDPVVNFINGNGSVVIHVVLVKSYRRAFGKTKFGRLFCSSKIGAESTNTREALRKLSSQKSSEGNRQRCRSHSVSAERPRSSVVLKSVYKPRALSLRPPTPPAYFAPAGDYLTETDL